MRCMNPSCPDPGWDCRAGGGRPTAAVPTRRSRSRPPRTADHGGRADREYSRVRASVVRLRLVVKHLPRLLLKLTHPPRKALKLLGHLDFQGIHLLPLDFDGLAVRRGPLHDGVLYALVL